MNGRPSGSLLLSKAIEGFISFKTAESLSDRTVDSGIETNHPLPKKLGMDGCVLVVWMQKNVFQVDLCF
jgi:hypothetical protein